MVDPSARGRTSSSRLLLTVLIPVAGVLLLDAGCSQPPAIGNACAMGSPGDSQEVTISTPALECESRICLQVGSHDPLCTGECGSDDDCGRLAPTASQLCHQGFTCRAASPFGPHPCQRLCLCRDNLPAEVSCAAP